MEHLAQKQALDVGGKRHLEGQLRTHHAAVQEVLCAEEKHVHQG